MATYLHTWHERLKYARLDRGHSNLTEFARLVGVKPPTAHAWESGETKELKGKSLRAVCRVLRISQDWLIDNIGEMDDERTMPETEVRELPEKYQRVLGLLDGMTDQQVDECIKNLEGTKQMNEAIFKELSARRRSA